MVREPAPPRHGRSRAARALVPVLLPLALAAQGLPEVPRLEPQPAPLNLGELLPLRPMVLEKGKDSAVPIKLRGRTIQESPEGWTLEEGAVESPDLLLLADHIRFSTGTGLLQAEGHIRLEGPGLRLRCGRLAMDWNRRSGDAWALELELPPTWVLRSQKVSFVNLKHWEFDQVELSPCPQENPGWKAQVSKLTVDLDGFARIRNLWIWVGNVPTFYFLPWAIYPARAERTSGLLPSTFAFSGPNGASLGVPYYQVLGPSADTTLAPEYYSRQGMLWGGELRWAPEPTHQGAFSGQYIHQKLETVAEDGSLKRAYRYRYSLKELWQREDGWQFTANINQASDSLLDADYGKGVGGLGAPAFDSAVYLGKNYPWASFNLTAAEQRSYFLKDDISFWRPDFPTSMRRQTLPSFQGRVYPVPVGSFYFDAGLQLSRLAYKLDLGQTVPGADYTWGRDDAFARLQGRLGQWGPFRADLQTEARFTHYTASLHSAFFDTAGLSDGSSLDPSSNPALDPFRVDGPAASRVLGSARLQLSGPPIGRSFSDVHLFGYTGELKHIMDPFFALTDTSRSSSEGRLPHFDEVDSQPGVGNSAAGEQSLELGVKQHILGRAGIGLPFIDLVRWKVSTRFHMKPILLADGRSKKGWASLDNEIDIEPNETLRISFRRSSDVSDSSADNSLSADYRAGDGSRFSLAYFSTGINRFLVRQKGIQLGGLQRLWDDRIRLEVQANYDFRLKTFSNSQIGLAYMTPCVATSLRYSHVAIQVPGSTAREDRLELVMTLKGLGDLGSFAF
jgi:hypothetical protein